MSQTLTFQTDALKQPRKLEGLGGWLILFAVGSILTPIKTISNVVNDLTAPGIAQAFQVNPVLMDGLAALDVAAILLTLVTAWAFFAKKAVWPPLYIVTMLAFVLIPVLGGCWTAMWGVLPAAKAFGLYGDAIAQGIGAAIPSALWIWYLKTSVRVRNTFVR
jgi:hypothetical protein